MQQISLDWITKDTISLIVDVPAEHLNSLDLNPPWDLIFLFLVLERNPYCLILPLQYFSNSVVYDPTAFTANKL
jgi:hypothetical protein